MRIIDLAMVMPQRSEPMPAGEVRDDLLAGGDGADQYVFGASFGSDIKPGSLTACCYYAIYWDRIFFPFNFHHSQ